MPPRRSRHTVSENDENRSSSTSSASSRLGAVKSATVSDSAALPGRRAGGLAGLARKRAALGDVTNKEKEPGAAHGQPRKVLTTVVNKGENATGPGMQLKSGTQVRSLRSNTSTLLPAPSTLQPQAVHGVAGIRKKRASPKDSSSSSFDKLEEPRKRAKNNASLLDTTLNTLDSNSAITAVAKDPLSTISTTVQDWDDLDAEDANDTVMCSEYVSDIFDYMKAIEKHTMADENYMESQPHLAWRMRGILSDWLIEVHTKFRLLPETLFLAVNIIDRFLSIRVVEVAKLQLVGITAMFIASKYEEVISPSIQNFSYVADRGYDEDQILRAERYILSSLGFNLSYPNPMNYLRRISKADRYDTTVRTFAKYLVEISIVDHAFLKYSPSLLSAAAMYFARMVTNKGKWDANLVHYSLGYTEADLKPVAALMADYILRPCKHEAFFNKYAAKKFFKASIYIKQWCVDQSEYLRSLNDAAHN